MGLPKVGLCTKPKQGNSIEHLNENQLYRPESPTFGKPRNVVGDFRRANSSLFIGRKKFETVIKTIIEK